MKKRIYIKEVAILILGFVLSIASAAICMQIMGQFGTTPNTSFISAVLVMVVARIPLSVAKRFRNLERQNYVLSMASAAGFAAANCGFVAIATMFVLGRSDLIFPMLIGTLIGSMISVFVAGRIFGTGILPEDGAWPSGVATATALEAGDEGGKKGFHILQGITVGAIAGFFGIPAAGVGIAFIANMVTMAALGSGMIIRGFSPRLLNYDIGQSSIPQGIMIGAGVVAFVQIFFTIIRAGKKSSSVLQIKALANAAGLFVVGAVLIAVIMGVFSEMSLVQSILWVAFAGAAALVVMILVGTAIMHSGWGPTFAVVAICLTVGLLAGFPPIALAVLVGYLGSVGPCIADAGVGFKTGWIIRGKGTNKENEKHGRRQQVLVKQLGVFIGIAMALFFGNMLINNDVIPPMSFFYAETVMSVPDATLLRELALWAVPGVILQAAFGNRSAGLMLASGLLVNNWMFGVSILLAIGLRLIFGTKHMGVRAPGLIAGDGLFGFISSIF